MPILRRLKEILDEAKVSYEVYNHPQAFTAQEIAARQHMSGKEMAKVVILKADDSYVMAVVPANSMVSIRKAKAAIGAGNVSLATEAEFTSLFPECEIGAMPPFGNLFNLRVYVDPALEKDETIFFNAGNHIQTVRLKYKDFRELVNPIMAPLADERERKAA
ncbi:MAG: YbaK/EbsC family protein [Deltaproteobacteria bacterium]|nr:YbaK/EbsC family protein [Deltaproteobacteria bacterium]